MKLRTQAQRTQYLAQSAMIAALYTVLTLWAASMNLAYLPAQFRFSEALTILPIFTPAAIPGLTIGCLLSNIFSGYGWQDMVFGTLATFLSSVVTWKLRKFRIKGVPILAPLPPVVFNAVIVGAMIVFVSPGGFAWVEFWSTAASIAIGEFLACYVLGLLLAAALQKSKAVEKILNIK